MSVFPAGREKVFTGSSTFPSFVLCKMCKLAALVIHHHMDCDWQISVLNVSFDCSDTPLSFSEKTVQLPWSCYFLHYLLRYSAIILLSIAYNSSQDGIIATWQILKKNTNSNQQTRWELGLTWWFFFAKVNIKKYLFISYQPTEMMGY